jgi:hypothetical protein
VSWVRADRGTQAVIYAAHQKPLANGVMHNGVLSDGGYAAKSESIGYPQN